MNDGFIRAAIALAAVSAVTTGASAQQGSNRLFIEQDGSNNSLVIDQSNATGSNVGGLSVVPDARNTLRLEALIGAPALATTTAATQTGDGNTIDVTVEGSLGQVFFSQNSTATGGAVTNDATVSLTGDQATAALFQYGASNTATLNVTGLNATGAIAQIGNGNEGELLVSGQSAEALLLQNGNGNVATGLEVSGTGASFVLQQIGNGLQASGTTVSTNAQGVTIIQRSLLP